MTDEQVYGDDGPLARYDEGSATGKAHYLAEKPKDNPYPPGSPEHDGYSDGYDDGGA